MGRDDRILALLIEGEPSESFPLPLRHLWRNVETAEGMAQRRVEEVEPLAADVRQLRKESKGRLKRLAKLRMLACILGVPFDDLRQRERFRRHRTIALAAILTVFVVVALVAIGLVVSDQAAQARKAQQLAQASEAQRKQAEERAKLEAERAKGGFERGKVEADRAARALERQERATTLGKIRVALDELRNGNYTHVRKLLDGVPKVHRNWEWYYVDHLCNPERPEFPHLAGRFLTDVAYSSDGCLLAVAGYYSVSQKKEWCVELFDAVSGKSIRKLEECGFRIAFSPDRRTFATSTAEGKVTVWDPAKWAQIFSFQAITGYGEYLTALVFSNDGKILITGDNRGKMMAMRFGGGSSSAHDSSYTVDCIASSPRAPFVAVGGLGHLLSLWSIEPLKLVREVAVESVVYTVAFSSNGEYLAAGQSDGVITVWQTATCKRLLLVQGHRGAIKSLAYSQDGRRLASGGEDGLVTIWDVGTGRERFSYRGHLTGSDSQLSPRVAVSPDGRFIASACEGAPSLRVWSDLSQGKNLLLLNAIGHQPVAFSPDEDRLLTEYKADPSIPQKRPENTKEMIIMWDTRSGNRLFAVDGEMPVLSPDGNWLVTFCNGLLTQWNARTGEKTRTYVTKGQVNFGTLRNTSIIFSPDCRWLSVIYPGLFIFETASGDEVFRSTEVGEAAFSQDGHLFAVADPKHGTVVVRDTAQRLVVATMNIGRTHYPLALTFAKTNDRLVYRDLNDVVRICSATSGQQVSSYTLKSSKSMFLPGDRFLWSWDRQGNLEVLDALTGEELINEKTDSEHGMLFFSPDGQRIAWPLHVHDRTTKVVLADATTGLETFRFDNVDAYGYGRIAFSSDRRQIAIPTKAGVEIWGGWSAELASTTTLK